MWHHQQFEPRPTVTVNEAIIKVRKDRIDVQFDDICETDDVTYDSESQSFTVQLNTGPYPDKILRTSIRAFLNDNTRKRQTCTCGLTDREHTLAREEASGLLEQDLEVDWPEVPAQSPCR